MTDLASYNSDFPLVAYFVLTGGRYNPFQLATISKPIEVALIVVSLIYFVLLGGEQPVTGETSAPAAVR